MKMLYNHNKIALALYADHINVEGYIEHAIIGKHLHTYEKEMKASGLTISTLKRDSYGITEISHFYENASRPTYSCSVAEGFFLISYKDKPIAIYHCYTEGLRNLWVCVLTATRKNYALIIEKVTKAKAVHDKPKPGLYRAYSDCDGGLHYQTVKDTAIPNVPIVHKEVAPILQHIGYYFDHIKDYIANGRSGRKTVLLYGPQGTGKTSICYMISREFRDTHSVVFTTDINSMYSHVQMCAKHKIATIVILEDADAVLRSNVSEIKNFLAGVDSTPNPSGCYIVMTTNFPNRIDPTILHRRGRIDRKFNVGKLSGEELNACVDIYFAKHPEIIPAVKDILKDGSYSGSEVEAFYNESIGYATGLAEKLDSHHVKDMLEEFEKEKEQLDKLEDEYDLTIREPAQPQFGFRKN